MTDVVELRLLGPFELCVDGVAVDLRGVKPQQLLATLALHNGRTVSVDQLIDVMWPRDAPRSAVANIQTYISTLRTYLGEQRLRRQAPGYRLSLRAAEFDVQRFDGYADSGSLADLEQALALWRGTPCENLPPSPLWRTEVERLEQRRRTVRQDRARLLLEAGDASSALADLRELVNEDPLREESWLLLVAALEANGRRAEALTAYADARRILAAELGIEPGERLQLLYRKLLAVSVGASARLDADAATVLRGLAQLGLHSAPEWVASALLDRRADVVIEQLVNAKLLRRAPQRQLALPALISLLAVDLPGADAGDAAVTRVLSGYLHLAEQAAAQLPAQIFGPGVAVAPRWTVPVPPMDAGHWFAAERANLVAAVRLAAKLDHADLAWELAHAMVPWCDLGGHVIEWEETHRLALAACREVGDLLGEAVTLRGTGQLHLYRDQYPEAIEAFSRARLLFARLGNVAGEAGALAGLGAVHRIMGSLDEAYQRYEAALRSYVEIHDRNGQAYALGALGQVWLARRNTAEAEVFLSKGLSIASEVDDRHRIAHLTHQLGLAGTDKKDMFVRALKMFTDLGDAHGQAYCLTDLAGLEPAPVAVEHLTAALSIFERIGDRRAQAQTARRLSELHRDAGRPNLSVAYLDEARRLQTALG